MPANNATLGLCFFGNQLFYAASTPLQSPHLTRIGAIDFNFNIGETLFRNQQKLLQGVRKSIDNLTDRFNTSSYRILLYPTMECWATLPKIVYDDAKEREAYINILMNGVPRNNIHAGWHALSNESFKLLQLRTDHALKGIQGLTQGLPQIEYLSAFEIGERWIKHAHPGGSFLTVGAFKNCLSISSFILGKLRGATYIEFNDPQDLPYLWLQQAKELSWMQGLHEQIQVYGSHAYRIIEILQPFWDDAGTITKMDSIKKMKVQADEDTYSFDLALAYPAIMLALSAET